jgi:DNA recombination protein RmuC
MEYVLVLVVGLVLGSATVLIINFVIKSSHQQEIADISQQMKDAFAALSFTALTQSSDELVKRAEEALSRKTTESGKDLDEKKKLIDQTLENMDKNLKNVEKVVKDFENDRAKKFVQLDEQLKNITEQTGKLHDVTGNLKEALSSTKARGQWGERMAEDVLRLIGFVEGINYQKQVSLEGATRPDYTFFLPQGFVVNMDVKFPWDNYKKYYDAAAEADKDKFKAEFLKDVKRRIKEVTGRDYINPEQNTVDYVLVFIPNEQVYRFILENDSLILDYALEDKVILCSPVTLYAILALIRNAFITFNLTQKNNQVLALFSEFNKQYSLFCEMMEKMGSRIDAAQKDYNILISTRKKQLERPLNKIEELRTQRGIPEALLTEGEQSVIEEGEESRT